MTSRDVLINNVAETAGISKNKAADVVRDVFSTIKEETVKTGSFGIVGFGSFKVVERAARKGRNPQTGEEIQIPARKAVHFKVGKEFKDEVKG